MPSIADLFISVSSDVSGAINGLTDVNTKVNGVSSSMAAAAPAGYALAGAAAAVGAGFIDAIGTASGFESAMSGINAVITPDQVQKYSGALHDLALKLGAETKYSALEAAGAIEELVKAGVPIEAVMENGAKSALALAAATGTDVRTAAELTSTAMNTYHISAEGLVHVTDQLTGVTSATDASINGLQQSLSALGPVGASLGISFDDVSVALGIFAQNGLKGSDAGTSLKTMMLNLEPTTKSQISAFEQLGLYTTDTNTGMLRLTETLQGAGTKGMAALTKASADGTLTMDELFKAAKALNPELVGGATNADAWAKSQGLVNNAFFDSSGAAKSMGEIFGILQTATANLTGEQKVNLLQTAFGTDAVRAALIASTEGAEGWNYYSQQIRDASDAQGAAATRMNNLAGSTEQLNGSIETAKIAIGERFLPVLRQLTDAATGLVNGFLALPGPAQDIIVVVTAGTAVVLGLAAAFILLTPALLAAATGFGVLWAAASPIIVPILAIAAAAALLYAAWQDNFGGIRDVTAQVWDAIQPAFQNIANFAGAIGQLLTSAFQGLGSAATPLIEQLSQALAPILAQLPGAVRTLGDAFNVIGVILGQVADAIRFLVTGDMDAFMRLLLDTSVPMGFVQVLIFLHDAFDHIGPVVHAAFDAIGVLIGGIGEFIGLLSSGDVQGAFNSLLATFGKIKEIMQPAWEAFLSWLGGALAQLPAFVSAQLHDLWNALGVPPEIQDQLNRLGAVFHAAFDAMTTLVGGIRDAAGLLASGDVQGAFNSIFETFGKAKDIMLPAWGDLLSWLGGELAQLPGFIGDRVGDMWNALLAEAGNLPGQLAPYWSNFLTWVGGELANLPGFIGDAMGNIWGGLTAAFDALVPQLAPYWDAFASWFGSILGGIPQFVVDTAGDVFGGLVALFAGLIDILSPYWDAFAGWFLSLLQGIPQFVIDNAGDVFGGIVQAAVDLAGRLGAAIDPIRILLANTFGNLGGWVASGGTPSSAGTPTDTTGTPAVTSGSGPLVSIGTLIISSQDEANAFLNLVAQAVLASARRVSVPTGGVNPVL